MSNFSQFLFWNKKRQCSLQQLCFFFWWTLLFIQPTGKFTALKYILMTCLLICTPGLLLKTEFRQRLSLVSPISKIAFLIVLWVVAVSIISPYPEDSFHALSRDFLLQLELLSFGWILISNRDKAIISLWAIAGGFLLVSALSCLEVAQHLFNGPLGDSPIPRSPSAWWGGYAAIGGVCVPFVIALSTSSSVPPPYRFFLIFLSIVGTTLTVLYGSRSPLLVIALSVFLLSLLLRSWKVLLCLCMAVLIGSALLSSAKDVSGYLARYRSLANADTYVTNAGLSQRLTVWSGVIDIVKKRPWTGYGYGWKKLALVINDDGFASHWVKNDTAKASFYLKDGKKATYGNSNPHNYFLQVAFEVGVIGLLLVFSFWSSVFFVLYRILRTKGQINDISIAITIFLFSYVLSNFANGYWVGTLANMACALTGVLLGLTTTQAQQRNRLLQ